MYSQSKRKAPILQTLMHMLNFKYVNIATDFNRTTCMVHFKHYGVCSIGAKDVNHQLGHELCQNFITLPVFLSRFSEQGHIKKSETSTYTNTLTCVHILICKYTFNNLKEVFKILFRQTS